MFSKERLAHVRKNSVLFVIFSCQFQLLVCCSDECRNIIYKIPIDDKILAGHVIANLTVNSKDQCEKECYFNPNCISLNYNTNPGETPNCQLSSSDEQTGLQPKPGFIYQAMQNNCAKNQCFIGNGICQSGYGSRGYRCVCKGCFTGEHCDQFENNTVLVFPNKSEKQVVYKEKPFPRITNFTISLWVQFNVATLKHTMFSYALNESNNDNEIMLYFTNKEKAIYFRVHEEGYIYKIRNDIKNPIFDGKWHHLAATWESSSGKAKLFLDRNLLGSKILDKIKNYIIQEGALVLGQDQDEYLAGYQEDQSLQGNLTSVNMWDRVLTNDDIYMLAAQPCSSNEGNIIKWRDIGSYHHEHVQHFCDESCSGLAKPTLKGTAEQGSVG